MSKKLSRSDALEDISGWNTDDVLYLLRKNGLEDCCKAVSKRQIDGDELLHLTEGKLALWKSDLTRPLIWSLWNFVEEVRKAPEKYVEDRLSGARQDDGQLSDNSSWGTDFEDEEAEENANVPDTKITNNIVPNDRHDRRVQQGKDRVRVDGCLGQEETRRESEGTYANCDSGEDTESTYANFQDTKGAPMKNVSRLHGQFERSLAEELRQQLELRHAKKPAVGPKPKVLTRRNDVDNSHRKQPQKSFLHDVSKTKQRHESQS